MAERTKLIRKQALTDELDGFWKPAADLVRRSVNNWHVHATERSPHGRERRRAVAPVRRLAARRRHVQQRINAELGEPVLPRSVIAVAEVQPRLDQYRVALNG